MFAMSGMCVKPNIEYFIGFKVISLTSETTKHYYGKAFCQPLEDTYPPFTAQILEYNKVFKDVPRSKSVRDKRELTLIQRLNTPIAMP